jgi:hypothetical protein
LGLRTAINRNTSPGIEDFSEARPCAEHAGRKRFRAGSTMVNPAHCPKRSEAFARVFDGIRPLFRLDFLVLLYQDKRTFKN